MAHRLPVIGQILLGAAALLFIGCEEPGSRGVMDIQLWHEIELGPYAGSFISPGDLDGDGRVDFVLHRQTSLSAPGLVAAISFDGEVLWERGDATLADHEPADPSNEPPCRGICLVYDLDQDGRAEVLAELREGDRFMLYLLDGETGEVERAVESPLSLEVRLPPGDSPGRGHAVGAVARLEGPEGPPSILLKYGSSNRIPGRVVALDSELEVLWDRELDRHAVGHVPTVADLDGDGRDELVAGEGALDDDGSILWVREFGRHADMTAVADVHPNPGPEVLMSICGTGPAYCLAGDGTTLWELSTDEVPHGQGIWPGDFIPEEPGSEVIILRQGHRGDFLTVRGSDGEPLAEFQHVFGPRNAYPDLPVPARWAADGSLALWIPVDRRLVDGSGALVQDLGELDGYAAGVLSPGTSKSNLAVQAFALDLCGDEREELVLYQPYRGRSILIFTQIDSDGTAKPYQHTGAAYNIHSYF